MISLFLEAALVVGLPGIYACGVSWALWSGVAKPWLFASACVVSLYILYILVLYFGAPRSGGYFLEVPKQNLSGEPLNQFALVFLSAYIKPMLLFSVLAVPLLWLLIKVFRTQP